MNPKSTALTEIGLPSWLVPIAKSVSYAEARLLYSLDADVYSYDAVTNVLLYGVMPPYKIRKNTKSGKVRKIQKVVMYFILKEEPTLDDE